MGEALWEVPEARGPVVAALIGSHPSGVSYSALGGFRVDVGDAAQFGAAVVAAVPLLPAADAVRFWSLGTNILTSIGRMSEEADTARLDVVTAQTLRTILVDLPAVAGWVDPEAVTRGLPRQEAPPGWTTLLSRAVAHLAVGQVDGADDALDTLEEAAVPATLGRVGPGLLEAARGWALLLRGDTAGGIRGMQAGLREAGRWSEGAVNTVPLDDLGGFGVGAALSFRLVATLASWPSTRDQGLRLLRDVWWPDAHYEVLRHYELGRSLERSGDGSGAARAYRRFLRLLEHADEGLLIADEMVAAREALSRLGG